jgi:hypothetical protein
MGNATGNGTKERDRSAGSPCHRGEMATIESGRGFERPRADCERDAFEFLSALAKMERLQLLTLSAMALEVLIVGYRQMPAVSAGVHPHANGLHGLELITGDAMRAADW